jgi:alcohol dehydrogenase, propanol-preferring
MGYRVAAISRGAGKEAGARQLGADHYIDASVINPAGALSDLGGASAVLSTAVSSDPGNSLLPGIEPGGELVVIGAEGHTVSAAPLHLMFGSRTIRGTLTGSSIDNEDNLAFAARTGIRSRNEVFALSAASEAYARMDSGAARFRVVLDTAR